MSDGGTVTAPRGYSGRRILRKVWRAFPENLRATVQDVVSREFLSDWRGDSEYAIEDAAHQVRQHTMIGFRRLATLFLQVKFLDRNGIAGDLVECGVWRGGASAMMALAHLSSSPTPTRRIHLFDSWCGLPEPRAEVDGTRAVALAAGSGDGRLRPIGECSATLMECRRLLEQNIGYPSDLLSYHQGWFQDTLPSLDGSPDQIALLRLDGDWYESTAVCLQHLYPRVVSNGLVVIDDYGYWPGCRKAVDEFLEHAPGPVMLHSVDSSGRYWIKP
jgi:O-methyltransferase